MRSIVATVSAPTHTHPHFLKRGKVAALAARVVSIVAFLARATLVLAAFCLVAIVFTIDIILPPKGH